MRQPNFPDEERDLAVRARARHDGPVRRRIVQIAEAAAHDWRRAPDMVARGLREARELGSAERRFASDAVHELCRWRRRLIFLANSEDTLALFEAWLAPAEDAEMRIAAIPDPIARLGVSASYPDWMVARLVATLGEEQARKVCEAMNRRAPLTVRANRLKGDRYQLAERLRAEGIPSQPTVLARDGLVLETRRNVYALTAFREGWMELQDEASQLVAELVATPPRGTVIDACAGAGGKTLALAALLENRGRITAYDISGRKLDELRRRARRAGVSNVSAAEVESRPPEGAAEADRVLIDAPCSGLGVIRRNPESKWRVTAEELEELGTRQRAILDAYAPLVKPGGRLIYATCSLLAEENDARFDRFLEEHREFEAVTAKEILGRERASLMGDGLRLRLLPHQHDTDGFFAAVARRRT